MSATYPLVHFDFFRPGAKAAAFTVSAAFDMKESEAEATAIRRGYPLEDNMVIRRREEPVHVG